MNILGFLIFLLLAFIVFRGLSCFILLFVVQHKLNDRIELIVESLPDERAVTDLEIEIMKVKWIIDYETVLADIFHLFRPLDSLSWINPRLLYILYEQYTVPNK